MFRWISTPMSTSGPTVSLTAATLATDSRISRAWLSLREVRGRRRDLHRRVPLGDGRGGRPRGVLHCVGRAQGAEPDLVAVSAAQQTVDRGAVVLSGDIPEGRVDGAQRGRDRGAPEARGPVQVLPVEVDRQRVPADQVRREAVDDDGGRGGLGPEGPLPDPAQAGVGADPDQRPVADQQSLDGLYLHDASSCISTDVVSDWSASMDSPSSALVGPSGWGDSLHSAWK